ALLQGASVDAVIDVRRRNTGQLAGWSKRDDLRFILETFGIGYLHVVDAAPPDALLNRYRRDHDWDRYVVEYESHVEGSGALAAFLGQVSLYERPCLLCS